MCARRRAHDKIWKVWTFSFHWKKKLINLDKKQRFYKKMKMPMKSEKKQPVYVRAWRVITNPPRKRDLNVFWLFFTSDRLKMVSRHFLVTLSIFRSISGIRALHRNQLWHHCIRLQLFHMQNPSLLTKNPQISYLKKLWIF